MTNKIVVAKAGYNAVTETNPDNLKFSSDYNTLKYYLSGTASITINGDGTDQTSETTVAHNLGYIPFFIVYVNDFVSGVNNYSIPDFANSTALVFREAYARADATNLYLKMRNKSANNYTAIFYYKIFKNSLGL